MNYLVLGSEEGKKRKWIEEKKEDFLSKHSDAEIHTVYTADDERKDLSSLFFQDSLFSSARMIIVKHYENRGGKDTLTSLITEFLSREDESAELIIESSEKSDVRISREIKEKIGKSNTIIFWELTDEEKKSFITSYCKKEGFSISGAAVNEVLLTSENDTELIESLLISLTSFLKEKQGQKKEINEEDIERYCLHTRKEDGTTLFISIAERNLENALLVAERICEEDGYSLYRAFSSLSEKFRLLEESHLMRKKGISFPVIAKEVKALAPYGERLYPGIRARERGAFSRALSEYSLEETGKIILYLTKIDKDVKAQPQDTLLLFFSLVLYNIIVLKGNV